MKRTAAGHSIMPSKNLVRVAERGVTLIELMVGIAIGLVVVAVAIVALVTSRGISGTVSESTTLQQQAAFALRVIGQQVRQAGSLELSLSPPLLPTAGLDPAMVPVAFDPPDITGVRAQFDRSTKTVVGTAAPSFTVGYQNYTESTAPAASPVNAALLRDCLGQNKITGGVLANSILTSKFERKAATNELVCTGLGSTGAQAIISNVTDFRLRYLVQTPNTANLGYVSDPSTVSWNTVYGVEVCLELTGTENNPTAGATYMNCSGVDTAYNNRLKIVVRNVFQIRSQGLS